MEKKKIGGFVVYIILSLIIILGLIIYICYDKGIIFSNNTNEETESLSENAEETEEENSNTDNSNNSLSTDDKLNTDENGIKMNKYFIDNPLNIEVL